MDTQIIKLPCQPIVVVSSDQLHRVRLYLPGRIKHIAGIGCGTAYYYGGGGLSTLGGMRVVPEYRRQGLTTKVMTEFVKAFGGMDLELCAGPSEETDIPLSKLIAFYERFGFRRRDPNAPDVWGICLIRKACR